MALILLGALVIGGLLVYMFYNGELKMPDLWGSDKIRNGPFQGSNSEPPQVIVLPTDLEKEKKKRNVKTGKE